MELFGTDEQQAVLRRGRAMADLFADHPGSSYYGRTVGLVTRDDGDLDTLCALARVQGSSSYGTLPDGDISGLSAELVSRGFTPMHYAKWEGDSTALSVATRTVETCELPNDLTLLRLDTETPPDILASMATMALGVGVLPLCGDALRGQARQAVCLVAHDSTGEVVSCAAASAFAHPEHPSLAGQVWWGMLATHPARRGQGLALLLGAHAMLAMHRDFGYERFMTGVEPGNAPSETVCARMGLAHQGRSILGCADPMALSSGRMTK